MADIKERQLESLWQQIRLLLKKKIPVFITYAYWSFSSRNVEIYLYAPIQNQNINKFLSNIKQLTQKFSLTEAFIENKLQKYLVLFSEDTGSGKIKVNFGTGTTNGSYCTIWCEEKQYCNSISEKLKEVGIETFRKKGLGDFKDSIKELFRVHIDDLFTKKIVKYVYFIPIITKTKQTTTGIIVINTNWQYEKDILNHIQVLASGSFAGFYEFELEQLWFSHALRSAVAAIMARNMSHQQGSSVIPYLLSLSGGSSLENIKILKQYLSYIEQRMDFIATVATMEFPKWGISLKFFRDLVVGFISQYGLIDNICKSEGYNYNNITFKVFINDDQNLLDEKDITSIEENDVDVFIPGGLTGVHAFYLILENIMRNSAKYAEKSDELIINIKLVDKDTHYEISIWDNISNEVNKVEKFNEIFRDSIIDKTGEKRSSAWGFAEMRLCAAYLVAATEEEAAGKLKEGQKSPLEAYESEDNTIGYKFSLNKPKLLELYGE